MAMGRPSIFAPKNPKHRHQGIMTNVGEKKFEAARRRLAELAEMPVKRVSDGDVFEYLSRGEVETIAHLKKTRT